MIDYTKSSIWNTIWSRPYLNYEKHHQLFWDLIRKDAKGVIVDLGCGSASCWKPTEGRMVAGYDFSKEAIEEAKKNCPKGVFTVADIANYVPFPDLKADTVVLCGVVNYYRNLRPLLNQVKRILHPGGQVLITINVIKDFPDREWDFNSIIAEFSDLGYVRPTFYEKIGWYIVVSMV
jgi:SAM-dependent methyltransferase